MAHLNLESLKVTKSTANLIRSFLWENKNELSNEMKLFYNDVLSMIERNAAKSKLDSSKITDMKEILERAYNIEKYVLASGAASYSVEFVKIASA